MATGEPRARGVCPLWSAAACESVPAPLPRGVRLPRRALRLAGCLARLGVTGDFDGPGPAAPVGPAVKEMDADEAPSLQLPIKSTFDWLDACPDVWEIVRLSDSRLLGLDRQAVIWEERLSVRSQYLYWRHLAYGVPPEDELHA